jgi:glycosyltransferase involved in cell wall biosynthesis
MPVVVLVSAIYPPEPVVSARMSADLADHLSFRDVDVIVICPFPSRPYGANYDDAVGLCSDIVPRQRIRIVRLASLVRPQSTLMGRTSESFSFGRNVARFLSSQLSGRIDVLYANTWPLLSQAFIAREARKQRIPLVLHRQDIYPESLVTRQPRLGRITLRPLQMLDEWICRKTFTTVVISDGMRHFYTTCRGVCGDRVVTIPNWQDEGDFEARPNRTVSCAHYRMDPARFTFLYLGNIGPVAGVAMLISAFHRAGVKNAQLIVAGDGSAKEGCISLVKNLAVQNVHFISDRNAKNVAAIQSMADVCLLPIRRGAAFSSISSKLPAYLFSGKPVLATVDLGSDTARSIEAAGCGWVGAPEDESWLAAKMAEISTMPGSSLREIGEAGRKYGLATFSKGRNVRLLGDTVLAASGLQIPRRPLR